MMTKVAVILAQRFADWEYALVAGAGGPFYGLDVRFFAPEIGEVRSQGGLVALVPHSLDEIPGWSPRAVVVVGGTIWETADAPDISGLLQARHEKGAVIAGICGGTLALARAGLLNGTAHTSNDLDFLQKNADGYSGSEHYRQTLAAVSSDRVITAPGTAPVSFTAAIFESVGIDPDTVLQFRRMLAAEHV